MNTEGLGRFVKKYHIGGLSAPDTNCSLRPVSPSAPAFAALLRTASMWCEPGSVARTAATTHCLISGGRSDADPYRQTVSKSAPLARMNPTVKSQIRPCI